MKHWKTIKSTNISPSKWYPLVKEIVELPDGTQTEFFCANFSDVVMILPLTADNKFILNKQYKHGVKKVVIEFPAGGVNSNETIKQAARRELGEETGATVKKLVYLGNTIPSPTKSRSAVHSFLGLAAKITTQQSLDREENIETMELTAAEIEQLIKDKKIVASDTIASFFKAKLLFPQLFKY